MDELLEDIKKGHEFRKGEGWEKTITTDDIDYIIQQAEKIPMLEEENKKLRNAFKIINNAFNNDQVDNDLFIAEVEDVLISLEQEGLLTDGF